MAVTNKENGAEIRAAGNGRAALRKAETRARIKAAARAVFAEKGYEKANVSDIVRAIGMAQGTFYYHFQDKKSILMEMLNEYFDQFRAVMSDWMQSEDAAPDVTYIFARRVAVLLYENKDLTHIIMQEAHNADEEVRRLIHGFNRFFYEQVRSGLDLGVALGLVRPMDTRLASVALVGMIREVVADRTRSGEAVDIEHLIRELAELQNHGIRMRPGAGNNF
jgi:AcrR family transcriptional regulator